MAKKLLVVDSNLAIQKLVEYNLSREKFEVTCLNDGLSALDLLTKIDPDLILADLHLEGISFIRFCEKVKQKQSTKERPILVLVNATDSYDPNKLVALGVVDFVKKPLEPKDLIEKLKELSQDIATVIDNAPKPSLSPSVPPRGESPGPTPAQTQAAEKDQSEMVKMEELLGWSLPGEKGSGLETKKTDSPVTEQDNEMTMIQSRVDAVVPPAPPQSEPFKPESSSRIEDAEQTMVAMNTPLPAPTLPVKEEPPDEAPATPSSPITSATLEAAFPNLYADPVSVEIPPPSASPASAGEISKEMAEAIVSKIAKEIIEKVAWDVVPSLAEIMIKEELEKLKSDKTA